MSADGLARFRAGGMAWVTVAAAAAPVRELVAPALGDPLSLPGAVLVKRNLVRTVVRADLPGLGDVILKRYAVRGPRDWTKYTFKRSRAMAEWEIARGLAEAGIPSVEPLAMGEDRRGVLRDASLVVRTIPDAVFLNAYVENAWGERRDEHRTRLFLTLARIVRRMHDAGFVHNDLHGGNVLVNGPPESAALHIIDLHSVTRSAAPRESARWFDLVKLLHSIRLCTTPGERVALCRGYEEEGGRPSGTRVGGLVGSGRLLEELEPRIAALEEKRVRSRTDRALGKSSKFDVTREGGFAVHHLRSMPAAAFVPLIEGHRRSLAEAGRAVLKRGGRSALTRQSTDGSTLPRTLIVKEYRVPGIGARIKNVLRRPRAVASWIAGHGLLVRGFAAAEPLALLLDGPARWLRRAYVVMEDLGDETRLDLVVLARFAGAVDHAAGQQKRLLIAATAALLRDLHAGGVYHADLKAVNLFVRGDRAHPQIVLADYDRVEFGGAIPLRRRLKNLAQLSASVPICISVTDRLRFFRDYARDEPALLTAWKECFREVIALCRHKIVVRMDPIE